MRVFRWSSIRRTRTGAAGAVLAVLAVLVSPLAAVAADSVTIDVTVNRVAGLEVQKVLVSAFRHEDDRWQVYDSVEERFEDDVAQATLEVPGGSDYRVCAQDPANAYVVSCYGGGTSPGDDASANVPLTDGHGSVTLRLGAPTFIGGTVTDDLSQPIPGARVRITRTGSEGTATTYAAKDGSYRVPVNEGSYLVAFDAPGHAGEYYDDTTDPEQATQVRATEEAPAEGIDAALDRLATISGHVTTTGLTQDEADNLEVVALDGDDEVARDEVADGDYTLTDLLAGDYRVCVAESAAVITTCLDDPVTVVLTQRLTGVDLTPVHKGRIVGTVSDRAAPVAGVKVTAYAADGDDWRPSRSAHSGEDGRYALRLDAGEYKIGFSGGGHLREYYQDSGDLAGATSLVVRDAQDTLADAELAPGGTISGAIAGPDGDDLEGLRVVAYAFQAGSWREVADDEDLAGGSYALDGLAPGGYRVCAVVTWAPWRPGCVGGPSVENAVTITVEGTETVPGKDLALVPSTDSVLLSDVSVEGDPVVGRKLTASATVWPSDAVVTWIWKRGTTTVSTGPTYVVQPGDVDAILSVEVSATYGDYEPGHGLVGELGPVAKAVFAATPSPAVSGTTGPEGTPRVGDTLRAVTGSWSPAPDAFAYEWRVEGTTVGSGASYLVREQDQGKPVSVRVRGTRAGYEDSGWQGSSPTADVLAPPVLVLEKPGRITGDALVGGRLSAVPAVWNTPGVEVAYQWRLGAAVIGRGPDLVLPASLLGKRVELVVTGSRLGSASVTSAPVASEVVKAGRLTLRTAGKVKGKAKAGKKLTYVAERTSPVAVTRSYQWLRNGKPIKKATKASYKLTKKDKGKKIAVRVTLGAPGYQPLVVKTAAVKVKK